MRSSVPGPIKQEEGEVWSRGIQNKPQGAEEEAS